MLQLPLTHFNKVKPTAVNVPRRLSRRRLPRCQSLPLAASTKGMRCFHEIKLEVRPCELDQFGVVNNAVYSNYFEYGTHDLVGLIGFDADTILAVSEMSVKYIAPLRKKDKFLVKVRIYDYSSCRLYFEDLIVKLPNEELIVHGKSTIVILDKKHRPCRISPSMISKFDQFLLREKKIEKDEVITT